VIKNSLITISLGLIMLFLTILELIFSNEIYRYLGLLFLLGISIAITITNMSVIISDSTNTLTQGTVLSVSQSLRILIGAIFCNVAALSCYVSFSAPFILSIAFSGIALLSILIFSKKYSYLEIKCIESAY
jgi:MFS family permease